MKADIDLRIADEGRLDLHQFVTFHVMGAGAVRDHDCITVWGIRNAHPPLVDTFALSSETQDVHVVFSGDAAPIAALETFAQGADC